MFRFVEPNEDDARIRLRRMRVTGANTPSVNEVTLYQDDGTIESCPTYGTNGTSPCDDVFQIPVINTQLFRYVKISVPDYLNFCEVLVYAGNLVNGNAVLILCDTIRLIIKRSWFFILLSVYFTFMRCDGLDVSISILHFIM